MTTTENTLDVTQIEPRLKHPTIFQYFDALHEGEAFVIHNDHDPRPLYYQLLGERGDIFNWEYLEQGPEIWEVKIAKKKLSNGEETIGAIAAKDLRKAEVFKRYGLEFCCGGNKSLQEACAEAGVSEQEVAEELANVPDEPVQSDRDFNNWDLGFLADYIVNIHHKYIINSTKMLTELAQKIKTVHGADHPELAKIQHHVNALLDEMHTHQEKEERVLFPFIKKLEESEKTGKKLERAPFGTVGNPVQMMKEDHVVAADHVHAIAGLSNEYKVPADGCESYKLYYSKLREFDDDLHQHIHLENNILFPKALALEEKLTN